MNRPVLAALAVCLLLALAAPASALPIEIGGVPMPNEMYNGDFEIGVVGQPPPGWEVPKDSLSGLWVAVIHGEGEVHTPEYNQMAGCNVYLPEGEWGDQIRQVIDESDFMGWDPSGPMKIIDLTVDIHGDPDYPQGDPRGAIRFRLDMWNEKWNYVDDPALLPPPTDYTDWVEYYDIPNDWVTVNPFNRILLDYQPRWVSVEIEFMQPDGVNMFVDNVYLTGQCLPEPATLSLLGLGLLAIARRRRRH